MNKILIFKEKYPKIKDNLFDFIVNCDPTPTHKYLGYMLKIASLPKYKSKVNEISTYINSFDSLLPYISNKDIYSSYYEDFEVLKKTVDNAVEVKEEKTFNKIENIYVIYEDDEYLLLEPKTYKGSLKYGSSTKWCTASKEDDSYFTRYTKNGNLAYLISKKNNKEKDYNKIAFYMKVTTKNDEDNELSLPFTIWNEPDASVKSSSLKTMGGWDFNDVIKFTTLFRVHCVVKSEMKKLKQSVISTIDTLSKINIEEIYHYMDVLKNYDNTNFNKEQNIIDSFLVQLKEKTEKYEL